MADEKSTEAPSTSEFTGESSESTVELNIKTLDSQIYSFRVDKNIPVQLFKEKIADAIGLPVGQQRLIFRGKVLKDDHSLSEYHVEDGHTLHLVARQPAESQPLSGSNSGDVNGNNDNRGTDAGTAAPRNRVGQVSHSVVLGTFNVGDQSEGAVPDLSRIIGAVLNSFGLGNQTVTSGPRSMTSTPPANAAGEVSQGTDTEGTRGNVSGRGQAGGQMHPVQPFPNYPLPSLPQALRLNGAAVPVPSLHMPIPDSLNTLSEFINRMEVTLSVYGNQQNSSPNSAGETRFNLPSNAQGLPTPEALNVILRRAQQLLMDHAATSLSHIAGRLEGEGASTDPAVRSQIQAESVQIGLAMQHLGALFLELGRTILTLRMGNSSAESVVNAGPAVYISPSGPNPIMVQPFPLQTNSLLAGASAAPQANPVVLGPTGFGDVPRHINIHIHAGSSLAPGLSSVSSRATPGEGTQGGRPSGTGTGDSGSTRVLPVRNVIAAAVPARSTEGRGHILSTLYPLQTRSQQTNPSNSTSTQNPSVAVSNTAQPGVVVSVPQPPLESYSLPTIVAEVSSCVGNIVADLQRENPVPSGQLEASTVQGLSVGSEVGSDALDRQNNSLAVNGAGETHVSKSEGQGPQLECCVSGNHDDTDGGSTLKDASTYSVGTSCGFPSGENLLPPQPEVDSDNAPRSSQGQDPPEGVKAVPLGLGMGDLKPRRRSKQTKLQGKDGGGGIPCVPPNSQDQQATSNHRFLHSLESPGSSGSMTDANAPPIFGQGRENMALGGQGSNGQFDVSMMSQVLDNPVLNGLLTGVSEQVGVGSPNILRNMLQQLAQSPPMRNTLNQIAQQIEGQDTESMFSGLGRGQGGGMDLSRMVQHMMPIVSQVLTRGSTNSQPFSGVQHEQLQQFNGTGSGGDNKQADKNSQIDLTGAARSIECHESPGNIFRAVVDSAVHLCGVENCSENLLEELCTNDDLVREFMEMLYHDIHRRLEADSESTGKS